MMNKSNTGEDKMRATQSEITAGQNTNEIVAAVPWSAGDIEAKNADPADVLVQFRTHLEQVEDLTARLRFVMSEVHQVLQRRNK